MVANKYIKERWEIIFISFSMMDKVQAMEGLEIQEGGNLDYYYIICIGEVKEVVFVIDEAMRLNYFQMSYKLFL